MGLTYLPVQLGWSMVGRVIDPSPAPWSVWVLPGPELFIPGFDVTDLSCKQGHLAVEGCKS